MQACTHIYAYTPMCTTCSECVRRCVCWCQKKHLCNIHTCPCNSAQNTCSKVQTTLTEKKCTYIYIHTHITRIHMHTNTHAHLWHRSTRRDTDTKTHKLCINMYTHTYTHVYICIQIHIHMHIHKHTYMHVYTHTRTYAHTYNMYICTHASTPGTKELQRLREELMQTPEALHVSFVQRNQPHLAPPKLGLHCTHFLRHQHPSTPHPLFPTYSRKVRGPRRAQFCYATLR